MISFLIELNDNVKSLYTHQSFLIELKDNVKSLYTSVSVLTVKWAEAFAPKCSQNTSLTKARYGVLFVHLEYELCYIFVITMFYAIHVYIRLCYNKSILYVVSLRCISYTEWIFERNKYIHYSYWVKHINSIMGNCDILIK